MLSPSVPEEDAPRRRRGTVRISNMNPKNIGPYMEGKEEEDGKEKCAVCPTKARKERKLVVGKRKDLMKN